MVFYFLLIRRLQKKRRFTLKSIDWLWLTTVVPREPVQAVELLTNVLSIIDKLSIASRIDPVPLIALATLDDEFDDDVTGCWLLLLLTKIDCAVLCVAISSELVDDVVNVHDRILLGLLPLPLLTGLLVTVEDIILRKIWLWWGGDDEVEEEEEEEEEEDESWWGDDDEDELLTSLTCEHGK